MATQPPSIVFKCIYLNQNIIKLIACAGDGRDLKLIKANIVECSWKVGFLARFFVCTNHFLSSKTGTGSMDVKGEQKEMTVSPEFLDLTDSPKFLISEPILRSKLLYP